MLLMLVLHLQSRISGCCYRYADAGTSASADATPIVVCRASAVTNVGMGTDAVLVPTVIIVTVLVGGAGVGGHVAVVVSLWHFP